MTGRCVRVGYVLKRFPRTSETFILNEILELERQGIPIEIFSLSEPADEVRHQALKNVQARVTYLPQDSMLKSWLIREGKHVDGIFRERPLAELGEEARETSALAIKGATVVALARQRGVKHLHAHFGTAATSVAMLAWRLSGIPYSFTAHAKDIFHESVDQALLKGKILEARFVITVSEYNRRYLTGVAGEDLAGKIVRVYSGIDLQQFHPGPSITREQNVVLAVGRLVEKKGFHHLVEACRLLSDRKRSFQCLIVGEGPERSSLAKQIATLGLQEPVILVGAQPQEQVLEMLKRATVFVLPSVVSATGDRDGLPTVLLEALAMGVPAISTAIAGIPEIIEHGRTGLLVPPADPMLLANAMEEVLADAELQERLRRQGRLKAEAAFDIRKNVLVLRDLFAQSAVGRNGLAESVLDEDRLRVLG